MYTLVERPDGYHELHFNGKIKSCPNQSLFFYANPINQQQMLTHKQPCCSDCSLMEADITKGEFTRKCENHPHPQAAEVVKQSTLTVIK